MLHNIPAKKEDMLKLIYEAMYGIVASSLSNLQAVDFTSRSPFPQQDHQVMESLSLVYENCALFADLYLRWSGPFG